MEVNYIYLLQEREFIKTNESIYKIGRTKQEHNKRLNQYPKGSILLVQIICSNCVIMEKKIITFFKEKYKHRKDIGNEYFEGNSKDMIQEINNIINNEQIKQNKDEDIDKNDEKIRTSEYQNNELLKIIDHSKSNRKIHFLNNFYKKII
jgi:hypothetical protein